MLCTEHAHYLLSYGTLTHTHIANVAIDPEVLESSALLFQVMTKKESLNSTHYTLR